MPDEKKGYYLYSVILSGEQSAFGPIGMGDEQVFTIPYKEIACVVSASPIKEWEIYRDNLMKHQKVNEEIMKSNVLLPIKFSTIAETSEQIVEKFLKTRYSELLEQLNYYKSRCEYGIKVFFIDIKKVYEELLVDYPALAAWRDRLAKLPFEQARNDMIILGQEVQNSLQKKKEMLETDLFIKLKIFTVKSKLMELAGERIVLSAVFLVSKDMQLSFDKRVEELVNKYADTLKFKYVGPTPPANFISITVVM